MILDFRRRRLRKRDTDTISLDTALQSGLQSVGMGKVVDSDTPPTVRHIGDIFAICSQDFDFGKYILHSVIGPRNLSFLLAFHANQQNYSHFMAEKKTDFSTKVHEMQRHLPIDKKLVIKSRYTKTPQMKLLANKQGHLKVGGAHTILPRVSRYVILCLKTVASSEAFL